MDDAAIVALLKRGDPDALGEISGRYRDRLVQIARAILRDDGESEDVAQEVLLRVAQCRDLEKSSALRSYLESTARRLAIDRLRRREAGARALQRATPAAEPAHADEPARRAEDVARVVQELRRLRDPYRAALTMRFLEGLGYAEIAGRLGTIERTARTWVGRGLSMLRTRTEWRT